jgi:hypothetical protein
VVKLIDSPEIFMIATRRKLGTPLVAELARAASDRRPIECSKPYRTISTRCAV